MSRPLESFVHVNGEQSLVAVDDAVQIERTQVHTRETVREFPIDDAARHADVGSVVAVRLGERGLVEK